MKVAKVMSPKKKKKAVPSARPTPISGAKWKKSAETTDPYMAGKNPFPAVKKKKKS